MRNCKPFHDVLRYVLRSSVDLVQGPECAEELYYGATVKQLNYHCPMRCHKSKSLIISEIAEETYIITHVKPPTEIISPKEAIQFQKGLYKAPGTIEITIPCNCELISNNEKFPLKIPMFRIFLT
ncbi:hypothetical protein JTB14_022242 [Gonioctena quinquepunctata]|nr:hypothetical protein JTB14_022242 [Gonioctena quinquepunctata]